MDINERDSRVWRDELQDYGICTSILDTGRAVAFTSFYYEQLRGIKLAAERARLGQGEIDGSFFNNADRLFRTIGVD